MNLRPLLRASSALLCWTLSACGSRPSYGGDPQVSVDAGLDVDDVGSVPVDTGPARTNPEITGFDLPVTTGSYWEIERRETFAGRTTAATYRMTLGAETTIAGVRAFAVNARQLTGATVSNLGTHWRYLSFEGHKIMGSEDGVVLRPLFDAWSGAWPSYGGFWNQFRGGPMVPTAAVWQGRSGWSLYQNGGNECVFLNGYGRVCGESDPNQSFQTTETFAEHIGPVKCVFHGCASGGCIDVVYEVIGYSVGAASSCGDGTCSGAETCVTCPRDCTCVVAACSRCDPNGAPCGPNQTCRARECDGVWACYPNTAMPSCASIGGSLACPRSSNYETCASDGDCGAVSSCVTYSGVSRCLPRCATADDVCPAVPSGVGAGPVRCLQSASGGQGYCSPTCARGSTRCPGGAQCRPYADGTYGYCH